MTELNKRKRPVVTRRMRIAGLALLITAVILGSGEAAYQWFRANSGWTTYTTNNSDLLSNVIYALVIDAEGSLWAGTESGLSVRDTAGNWTTYTSKNSGLRYDRIYSLATDSTGTLWIGTGLGLQALRADGSWVSYAIPKASGREEADAVRAIVVGQNGIVWAGTLQGLYRLFPLDSLPQAREPVEGFSGTQIWALDADREGRIWVGTWANRLAVLDPHGIVQVYDKEGYHLDSDWVIAVHIDKNDRVWVGSEDRGLSIRSLDDSWIAYPWLQWTPAESELKYGVIRAFADDSQGRMWVGTKGGGLALYDSSGAWKFYTASNSGLTNDTVRALAVDQEGYLWIGTANGLSVLDVRGGLPRTVPEPVVLARAIIATPFQVAYYLSTEFIEDAREQPGLFGLLGIGIVLAAAGTLVSYYGSKREGKSLVLIGAGFLVTTCICWVCNGLMYALVWP